MPSDLLASISFLVVIRVITAFLLLILMGFSFGKLFKIEMKGFAETLCMSVVLALNALYLLAYGIFLTESNFLLYSVFLGSFFFLIFFLTQNFKKTTFNTIPLTFSGWFSAQKNIYSYIIFSLYIFLVFYNLHLRPGVLEEGENGNLNLLINWDDLMLLSQINVARDYFFPLDNPTLPGEPPYYFSWLGNAIPIFLIKYFHIDQMLSYFIWGPIFIQTTIFLLVILITSHFSENKWVPVFSVNFFFFSPFLAIEYLPLRSQTGVLIVLSAMFFFLKYLSIQKTIYLVLSFSWMFLYAVKGNYLAALLPCFAIFYLKVLFSSGIPKWNDKKVLTIFSCTLLGIFLFWFSRRYFASTHFFPLPDQTFSMILVKLKNQYASIKILFAVILIFYGKKIIKKLPVNFFEKLLFVGLVSTVLFTVIANRYMVSDSKYLIYFGVLTTFPIVIQKLIPHKTFYLRIMAITLFIFPVLAFQAKEKVTPLETTVDELKMIKFMRNETPNNSVFLSNIYRYNDRPALLSALTYKKQFIDEGERFSYLFNHKLERRTYDYWTFMMCRCAKKDQERFIKKYPFLNYLIIYENNFNKTQNILIGMNSNKITPFPIFKPHSEIFKQVYKNSTITVYEISKKTV